MRRQAHGLDQGINLAWASSLNPKRVDKHKVVGAWFWGTKTVHHVHVNLEMKLRWSHGDVIT
jgi:hypothetical protein